MGVGRSSKLNPAEAPMAHPTEAACLLQTGALYPLRLGLRPRSGDDIFLGVKPGAFSLYFGDAPIYHFDLDGRWQRAFLDGVHYLKGLDTTAQALDRVREGESLVLRRRTLGYAESTDLDALVRSTAIGLVDGLTSDLATLAPPDAARPLSAEQARDLLGRVIAWDASAWFAHRERYLATYGPIPFLPPDTPSPVVLQATLGHSRGPGFGGEPMAEYYERTPAEMREHARDVARLLGRRALQCRQVFLAGPDVFRLGPDAVIASVEAAAEVFPIRPGTRPRARDVDVLDDAPSLDGFHAFLHEFDRDPFPASAWSELQARHFRRLILGIESGSSRVRSLYGREWTDDGLRAWVGSCPVGLGLVVVVGAGGDEGSAEHVEATVRLLDSLPIPPGSLVSLVDADELDTRPEKGFPPLDRAAITGQREELKARLSAVLAPRKVKVTNYSAEKRWQWWQLEPPSTGGVGAIMNPRSSSERS